MLKSSNYRENFNGSKKSVRIMEVFELQRFELWKAKYKSFLRKFHDDFAFDRIMEVFELRRFELERLYCIHKTNQERINGKFQQIVYFMKKLMRI